MSAVQDNIKPGVAAGQCRRVGHFRSEAFLGLQQRRESELSRASSSTFSLSFIPEDNSCFQVIVEILLAPDL